MAMTAAQAATFKTAVLADAALATARLAGDAGTISAYYNANAASGVVWRTAVSTAEMSAAIVWSEYAALTVAKQNAYAAMAAGGSVDSSKSNIQGGFSAVFAGTTSLTNLTALAQRVPTRFEALYAVANVTPLFSYIVTVGDVGVALG